MTINTPIIRKVQTTFELNCPGDKLTDDHIAKIIVHMINEFEKEKPLFVSPKKF